MIEAGRYQRGCDLPLRWLGVYSIIQSLKAAMTELTFPIIKLAFRTQSLTEKDYLSSEELYNVVSRLNNGEFDEETYEEIWDQCKLNSKGEVRLSDFIDVIMRGEALLVEKQLENKTEIAKIENEMKGKVADFSDQHRFKEQMDALLQEKTGVANSLDIIRKPFITFTENNPKTGLPQSQLDANPERRELIDENDVIAQLFEYDSSETAGSLATIFYLTVTLTALSWLSSFFICQFANTIAYTAILSQFAFQIVSRKLVRFNLLLLAGCTLLDLLWLILETGNVWYPPINYELAGMISTYLKFSVVMIIAGFCLRVVLVYYYLTQFHLDEFQTYSLKVFGKELNIQREAEPYTPNKNPLSLMLEPFFNKAAEEEQPQ